MAVEFVDASSEYLSYTRPASLDGINTLTVFCWLRPVGAFKGNLVAIWNFPSDKAWVLIYEQAAGNILWEVTYSYEVDCNSARG